MWLRSFIRINNEEINIRKLFSHISRDAMILDIGSGKGRNIQMLKDLGFTNVLGVEVNPNLVELANDMGRETISVETFKASPKQYDVALFSHVIEHFDHDGLFDFLQFYFGYAAADAQVIIVTPLESGSFYHDFDHVKPYHPQGIQTVFSGELEQVQFSSDYVLELKDIYFRQSPHKFLVFNRSSYLNKRKFVFLAVNGLSVLLWLITGKFFGRVTGWAGRFSLSKK